MKKFIRVSKILNIYFYTLCKRTEDVTRNLYISCTQFYSNLVLNKL